MTVSQNILSIVKERLNASEMTIAQFSKKIETSEATVKRIFSGGTCTLEKLDKICKVLNLDLADIGDIDRQRNLDRNAFFTKEQEELFAKYEFIFCFFYAILEVQNVKDIRRKFTFTQDEIEVSLEKLSNLNLILQDKNDRIKVLIPKTVKWIPGGLLEEKYKKVINQEFFDHDFEEKNSGLSMVSVPFSTASLEKVKQSSRSMIKDFLLHIDDKNISTKSERLWLVVAHRPWNFSLYKKFLK